MLAASGVSTFRDITVGDNCTIPSSPCDADGICRYPATPNYDLPTGLGAPLFGAIATARLTPALAPPQHVPAPTSVIGPPAPAPLSLSSLPPLSTPHPAADTPLGETGRIKIEEEGDVHHPCMVSCRSSFAPGSATDPTTCQVPIARAGTRSRVARGEEKPGQRYRDPREKQGIPFETPRFLLMPLSGVRLHNRATDRIKQGGKLRELACDACLGAGCGGFRLGR